MDQIIFNHDGTDLRGELFLPEGAGPHPTVLIFHSALGLKAHEREIADRLNVLGYAALAVDMYGETDISDQEEKVGGYFMKYMERQDSLRECVVGWFNTAAALDGVDASQMAAIGYCFGGTCVLELARSGADARAVVSFHGILKTHAPAAAGAIKGEVVAWCAGEDPYAPREQIDAFRDEMAAADCSHQVTIFGQVPHGFSDREMDGQGREGIGYDALADAVSWAGTVALLDKVMKV